MLAAYDRTHNSGWSWCFHNKHNLFIVGAKSMGMKIGEGCRNACTLFDLITQTGQYRRASRMFMLLEMVRASIRKEMAPVFGGSITLLVNRHRFPPVRDFLGNRYSLLTFLHFYLGETDLLPFDQKHSLKNSLFIIRDTKSFEGKFRKES